MTGMGQIQYGQYFVESFDFVLNCYKLEITCDFVSMLCTQVPVLQFQKRMCLSIVPPPLAKRPGCQGHHARACKIVAISLTNSFTETLCMMFLELMHNFLLYHLVEKGKLKVRQRERFNIQNNYLNGCLML